MNQIYQEDGVTFTTQAIQIMDAATSSVHDQYRETKRKAIAEIEPLLTDIEGRFAEERAGNRFLDEDVPFVTIAELNRILASAGYPRIETEREFYWRAEVTLTITGTVVAKNEDEAYSLAENIMEHFDADAAMSFISDGEVETSHTEVNEVWL